MEQGIWLAIAGASTAAVALIRKARKVNRLGVGPWVDQADDFEIGGVVLFLILFFASCAAIWASLAGR